MPHRHMTQLRSGTPFDPAPQFWIDHVEAEQPLTLAGRCFFGPVRVGMTFDQLATKSAAGTWHLASACRLVVEEIVMFGNLADELNQVHSALLVMRGAVPIETGHDWLLIASQAAPPVL